MRPRMLDEDMDRSFLIPSLIPGSIRITQVYFEINAVGIEQ
jgi:hypothetical protein